MQEDDVTLYPLLAHLYGASLGRRIADLAQAAEGESVVILNAQPAKAADWPLSEMTTDTRGHYIAVPDPLPTIDFREWSPQGTLDMELTAGWDVLIGFPPQGHRSGDRALHELIETLDATAGPDSRAFLLVTAGQVARSRNQTREALLSRGHLHTLALPTSRSVTAEARAIPTSAPVAVAHWRPGAAGETDVVSLSSNDERDAFKAKLSTDIPWSFAGLDPARAKKIDQWAHAGDARRMAKLVVFPRATDDDPGDSPVLLPGEIVNGTVEPGTSEREPRSRSRFIELAPGDVVGRTLGEPQWALLAADDVGTGLYATQDVLVLRSTEVDPRYLLAFLNSDAASLQLEGAAQGQIPRVSPSALRALLVPVLPVAESALHEGDPVQSFRATSEELAAELESRYRAAFDEPNAASVTAALGDATDDALMAGELLRRVTDPLHRARQFLPHPLARTIRLYENHRRAGGDVDTYQDLLRFGETVIILLGAVGLSYLRQEGHATHEPWQEKLRQGGVPLGLWLQSANSGAEAARRAGHALGGIAHSMSTKSTLNRVLDQFLQARKDNAHGAGPRSPFEYQQAILDLEEALHTAVAELGPIARADWFVVEQLSWSEADQQFTIAGRSLRGDHPDFEIWGREQPLPLEKDVVYVQLAGTTLSLGGYCLLRSCSVCLHEELYYPDRLRGSMARLRSLDRGHQTEVAADEIGLPVVA